MDEKHVHKTRHATATAAPLTKRVGYFGQLSSAGFAPPGLSPRQLAKENEAMVSYTGPSSVKTPLKKKSSSHEKLDTESESPAPSPRTPRNGSAQDRRASSKATSSATPKPRKVSSRGSVQMEEDEAPQTPREEAMDVEETVESVPSGRQSRQSPNKMDEDEQEDAETPKNAKKRSRGAITPSEEGIKKKQSRRTIATKRSAAAALMGTEDDIEDEPDDTPKSTGKSRSREKLSTSKPSRRHSSASSRDIEQIPVRSAEADPNEEDHIASSRPPKKKQKIQESASAGSSSAFGVASPARAPSSPSLIVHRASPSKILTPDQKKSSSLWNGFVSRSIQKIKNLGSSSPKSALFPSSADITTGTRDTTSEPTADMRAEEELYTDSIGSPGYRASTSAPHAVGSPSGHRVPIHVPTQFRTSEYDADESVGGQSDISIWRPPPSPNDFHRGNSLHDRMDQSYVLGSNDYLDSRSASAGQFNTPSRAPFVRLPHGSAAGATHSPTAFLASPQGPTSSDWSAKHGRSPLRIPTMASPSGNASHPPTRIIPNNPAVSNIIRHSPVVKPVPTSGTHHHHHQHSPTSGNVRHTTSPPFGRRADIRHLAGAAAKNAKRPGGIIESIKRGLRNLLFGVSVVALLVLVIWLFAGDYMAKFFWSDPDALATYCATQMKELLRRKQGDHVCDPTAARHISESDMRLHIHATCPLDAGKDLELVFNKLRSDRTGYFRQTEKKSWSYDGPDPILPWPCAIRRGFYNFLLDNILIVSSIITGISLIGFLVFKWKRSTADKALARTIAERIVEQLKEEYAKDGNNGYLVKDYMEDDHSKSQAEKRVWPLVVDLVESNIRVRTQPRLVHGDQLVTWVWSM